MKKLLLISILILCFSILALGKEVKAGVSNSSEIRALFVHASSMINPNWNLIAETAKNYSTNPLVIELLGNDFARYPGKIPGVQYAEYILPAAVDAAHTRGIELHVSMNVLADGCPDDDPSWCAVRADGSRDGATLDPCNPNARNRIKNLVEEFTSNFSIDGFMFDYIRYNWGDESYSQDCKAKFEAWLGESIPANNWPPTTSPPGGGDFSPKGSRYDEFMEWRIVPITELVRDMRSWMLAKKPNLEFSGAVWEYLGDPTPYPTYWRYWLGQDWANWIRLGYLDWVSPMVYTDDLTYLKNYMKNTAPIFFGDKEGIIPHAPLIDNCVDTVSPISNWANRINIIRQNGGDGWANWRYGGPGDGQGSGAPDIRNYLSAISLPPVFSIKNIQVSSSGTQATITWNTDLQATSKVEYNTSPLFTSRFVYDSLTDFNYWDIDHAPGTIVADNTNVTSHSITLTGLQEGVVYYYRVQSQDTSGIATSKVYTFTAGGVAPPTVTVSGRLIDKNNIPSSAIVTIFQQGTNNTGSLTPTSDGNYNLSIAPNIYDLQYSLSNFFISNFFVKLLSLNISSNLSNPVNYITNINNQNLSFTVNITDSQLIQTHSSQKPTRVLIAGTPITEVSSYSQLTNNTWYYDSTTNRFYILVSVAPPPTFNFSLSVSPTSASVTQGGSTTTTVSATLTSGTTQSVSFSCTGLPSGASCSFSPASCSPNCSSTLTISSSTATPTGTYPITISASGGGITKTSSYSLTVTPLIPSPYLFEDGFESGNFSAWTGVEGAAYASVQSTTKHHGTYAAKWTNVGDEASSSSYKTLASSYSTIYVRGYFRFDTLPDSNGDSLNLIVVGLSTNFVSGVAKVIHDGTSPKWQVRNNYYGSTGTAITGPTTGQWYSVELKATNAAGLILYVNGSQVASVAAGIANNINRIKVGSPDDQWAYSGVNGFTFTGYTDCVVVADTYIGPES